MRIWLFILVLVGGFHPVASMGATQSPFERLMKPGHELTLSGNGPKGLLLIRPGQQSSPIRLSSLAQVEFKEEGLARCDFRIVGLKTGMKISSKTKWQISSAAPIESAEWPGSLSYLVSTVNRNPKLSANPVLSAYIRCQKNLGPDSLADLGVRVNRIERQASN